MTRRYLDPEQQLCCSIQDAADLLGLNRATVYNLIAAGEFCKTVHFGKSVRVPLNELKAWLADRVQQEYEAKLDQAPRTWRPARDAASTNGHKAGRRT